MKLPSYLLAAFLPVAAPAFSQIIHLEGNWKFQIGDKTAWSAPAYDDSKWQYIHAPTPWEEEGFNGYDGFGWYRKKFDGRRLDKNRDYYLGLGFIDDCDEAYLNGRLIGFSGSMPPDFKTAYNTVRKYVIPAEAIRFDGENTVAVRVFDVTNAGGIVDGLLGIFPLRNERQMLLDLQGIWMFTTSRDGEPVSDEKEWKKIMVPGPWEEQGYYKYDGFGWYKKTFTLPADMPSEGLVLLLGKIDDFDKVYLNGRLIGKTKDQGSYGNSSSYQEEREYAIPSDLLNKKGVNTIEVLVEDLGNVGGIYEGPVGIEYNRKPIKR